MINAIVIGTFVNFKKVGNVYILSWDKVDYEGYSTCSQASVQLNKRMTYEQIVSKFIHARYTSDEEINLLSKTISDGISEEYNEYVRWCNLSKLEAKKYLGIEINEVEEARINKLNALKTYDKSNAVNEFTLNGTATWIELELRKSVAHDLNVLKAKGIENYTFWNGSTPISLPVSVFESILNDVELYALECFNVTASHKANIEKLETIDDINAYDFTVGYPDKLIFE